MALTPKQKKFCLEYCVDMNATQAAIRAGYSEKTANEQGARLLANASIQSYIASLLDKHAESNDLTVERVLTEYKRIAFSDIRKVVKWGVSSQDSEDSGAIGFVIPVSSSDLSDDVAACISEVSQTKDGIKVKLYDKQKALDNLSKYLEIFDNRIRKKNIALPAIAGPSDIPAYMLEVNRLYADGAITEAQANTLINSAEKIRSAYETDALAKELEEIKELIKEGK